jgi:hypothetical protein
MPESEHQQVIDDLIKERQLIQSSASRFIKFVKNFNNTNNIRNLSTRLADFRSVLDKFNKVQFEIDLKRTKLYGTRLNRNTMTRWHAPKKFSSAEPCNLAVMPQTLSCRRLICRILTVTILTGPHSGGRRCTLTTRDHTAAGGLPRSYSVHPAQTSPWCHRVYGWS